MTRSTFAKEILTWFTWLNKAQLKVRSTVEERPVLDLRQQLQMWSVTGERGAQGRHKREQTVALAGDQTALEGERRGGRRVQVEEGAGTKQWRRKRRVESGGRRDLCVSGGGCGGWGYGGYAVGNSRAYYRWRSPGIAPSAEPRQPLGLVPPRTHKVAPLLFSARAPLICCLTALKAARNPPRLILERGLGWWWWRRR